MNTHENRVEALFNEAINYTPDQRTAFLNGACGNNAELRQKVDTLLKAHDEADEFLPEAPTLGDSADPIEQPGTVIGRYKLLQPIGEGGMGAVFMAEQSEPVRRKVAFKIIKLGMDSKSVVARFEAERQALALMDHPNIAKVLDGGATETGRPFFVMELVKGVPIHTYCDMNQLATAERLHLFIQVCQAIQHAHQKGVIHRDIKPSNILVTLHDGKPVPKVIDFGIAKATNQRLTEKTLFTNYAQMIGTPAYMSPEQAEMSGLDVDTRTDVYSLGVLLYELLTGTTPFPEKQLLSQGYGEIQRILAEEEPERPSLRLSTLEGEQQSIVSKNRSEPTADLTKRIQGDLDWIVMKALEKDRTRRYETASSFADDVKRHLSDEPVKAAKPSFSYQLTKLYKRHRTPFVATVTVSLILVIATLVSLSQAKLARDATATATAATRSEAALRIEAQEQAEAAKELAEEQRLNAYVGDMMAADNAIRSNDLEIARDILIKHRPTLPDQEDLRSYEWRYLWEASRDRSIRSAHTPRTAGNHTRLGLGLAPNHKWLAVAEFGAQIRILSYPDLTVVHEISLGPDRNFNGAFRPVFSPDSKYLYTFSSRDPESHQPGGPIWRFLRTNLHIYDTTDWSRVAVVPNCRPPVIVPPDGDPIVRTHQLDPATGEHTGTSTWAMVNQDAETEYKKTPVFENVGTRSGYVVTDRNGSNRLSTREDQDSPWRVWDTSDPHNVVLKAEISADSFPVMVDRSGTLFASFESEGGYRGWIHNLDTKLAVELEPANPAIQDRISELNFTEDGSRLLASTGTRILYVWNTQNGKFLGVIPDQPSSLTSGGIVAVQNHIICLYNNADLRVWDIDAIDQSVGTSELVPYYANAADNKPSWEEERPGPDLVNDFHPRLIELFEAGEFPWFIPPGLKFVKRDQDRFLASSQIISPDGRFLGITEFLLDPNEQAASRAISYGNLPVHRDRLVRFYDLTNEGKEIISWRLGPLRGTLSPSRNRISRDIIFVDNHRLVVYSEEKLELWNLLTQERTVLSIDAESLFQEGFATSWGLMGDVFEDQLLLGITSASGFDSALLWDLKTDQALTRFEDFNFTPSNFRFSPTGTEVLIDCRPASVRTFQLPSGNQIHTLHGHRHSISGAYTTDGRTILTTSGSVAKLWNSKTGRELARLDKSIKPGRQYRFSKSGKHLYSLSHGESSRNFRDVHILTIPTLSEIDAEIDKIRTP